jgi:hypothetical protein
MYNVTIFKSRFSRCLICLESFTRADYHKNGGFRPNLSHFLIFDQMSMTFVHSASRGNVKARSQFQFLLRFLMFFFWWMRTSKWVVNVLSTCSFIWEFITHPLVHIHQKKKIALEIAAKIARSPGNEDGVKYLRDLVFSTFVLHEVFHWF